MLQFTGERIVPGAANCEPLFALKMYQEHSARYLTAAQLVAGRAALDVGCGVGYGSHILAQHGAASIQAFDLSSEAVAFARDKYGHPSISFDVANAQTFQFDRKFDVITCFELIEHVDDQDAVLANIARHLADSGVAFISTPRALDQKRSRFHTREFSFERFKGALERNFDHVQFFFENNMFTSHVGSGAPLDQPTQVEVLENADVFHNRGCDYFIAIVSNKPIPELKGTLVVNDEEYIKLLERDVAILHNAEDQLKARNRDLESVLAVNGPARVEELQRDVARLRAACEGIEQREIALRRASERLRDEQITLEDRTEQLEEERDLVQLRQQDCRQRETKICQQEAHLAAQLQIVAVQHANYQAVQASRTWRMLKLISKVQARALPPGSLQRRAIGKAFRTGVRPLLRAVRGILRRGTAVATPIAATPVPAPVPAADDAAPQILNLEAFRASMQGLCRRGAVRKVTFLVGCDQGESKRYRVANVIEGLSQIGVECHAINELDHEKLPALLNSDLFVIFRAPRTERLDDMVRRFRAEGAAIVYDVDDLIFEQESIPYVDALRSFNDAQLAQYADGVRLYREMLLQCDSATCSTDFLKRRIEAAGLPAFVVPNTINQAQLDLAKTIVKSPCSTDTVRVGYFSGSNTHDSDFLSAAPALLDLLRHDARVELVIVGELSLPVEFVPFRSRIQRHGCVPYLNMLQLLAGIDVNIAPLELNNPFTAGKSELKIFEAALVGVPTIASAVDSYSRCIDDGRNGFLASTTSDWSRALTTLVNDAELRKQMAETARQDFTERFVIGNQAQAIRQTYDQILERRFIKRTDVDLDCLNIAWIVPHPEPGSGGHRNIYRAVKQLVDFGHQLTIYHTWTNGQEDLKQMVCDHFFDLRQVRFIDYKGELGAHDVCFATHWSTVEPLMDHKDKVKFPFYFVQDYEPLFYPMGSEYIQAENTYKLGLTHITSGPWPAKILRNRYKQDADHFMLPVQKSVYHPGPRSNPQKRVLFFARPEMPRRCFDVGIAMLRRFKSMHPDIEVVLYGSRNIDSSRVGFPHTNLALLGGVQDLAELYRNADLGIVFSTSNPSLVPFEMMACGLPVADMRLKYAELNYGSEENLFLLDPQPEKMALEVSAIMTDDTERTRRAKNGNEFVSTFPDERTAARRIEELIKRKIVLGRLNEDQSRLRLRRAA